MNRREALTLIAGATAGTALGSRVLGSQVADSVPTIEIDPKPLHELSPHLYMQFMEPLGATDGSVEASWDHQADCWRPDLIEVARKLAPAWSAGAHLLRLLPLARSGRAPRPAACPWSTCCGRNRVQPGRNGRVHRFLPAGRRRSPHLRQLRIRRPPALHALQRQPAHRRRPGGGRLVAYCNHPDNAERIAHGQTSPLTVNHWQIGNETSYDRKGFDLETAGRKTIEFARQCNRSIRRSS